MNKPRNLEETPQLSVGDWMAVVPAVVEDNTVPIQLLPWLP